MGRPFSERGKVESDRGCLGPGLSFSFWVCPGGGGRRRRQCSWTYLQVEAAQSGAELLSAGQTVLLTAAGHAGEEAEQQEVTQQDFHGAAAAGEILEHKGGWEAIRTAVRRGWKQLETFTWGKPGRHSSEGAVPGPETRLPAGSGLSRTQVVRSCQPGLMFTQGLVSGLVGGAPLGFLPPCWLDMHQHLQGASGFPLQLSCV